MFRIRLLWFTFGFTSTYAVLSQYVLKDLLVKRNALASRMEHEFRVLETRISHLESSSTEPSSIPAPVSDQHSNGLACTCD
ncbi:unnamed protein product [Sphenostylis stenocarpa]|uniref:Uncharacterized protein n=1 Tax=Sphenostylis stenocarpa TaxID=92480 RepID=A0AA86SRE7_9FABA|nr:unnamed protein product [Sphenostylis stenocarpa]